MSLKLSTLTGAVDAAFLAVGEKVTPCTFVEEAVTGFDFTTGAPTSTTATVIVDGVLIKATTAPNAAPNTSDYVIVKTPTINASLYNEVTIYGDRYRITSYEDNQFTTKIFLIKDR